MVLWLAWLNLVGLSYRSLQFRGHSTPNVRKTNKHGTVFEMRRLHTNENSVIYFGMTFTRAEDFSLPQRSTELIASAENTSYGSIWTICVGVQSVSRRIETEAKLDS